MRDYQAGHVAQQPRVLTALARNLSSMVSTHTGQLTTHRSSSSGTSNALFWPSGVLHYIVCIEPSKHINIKK